MILHIDDDFDLDMMHQSGQCFRWRKLGFGDYLIPSGFTHLLRIKRAGNRDYDLSCDRWEFDEYWAKYFDMDENYSKIRGIVNKDDSFLTKAVETGQGIRILRQEPYETLMSFIISQRKSIPAIRNTIEKLCEKSLDIQSSAGTSVKAFFSPETILDMTEDELKSSGAGYRIKYLKYAAKSISEDKDKLKNWESLPDSKLFDLLTSFYGVGKKVANCVMLFAYHRLDIFPRDVWINRVVDTYYGGNYDEKIYSPYNGVMQQYMFYYCQSTGLKY